MFGFFKKKSQSGSAAVRNAIHSEQIEHASAIITLHNEAIEAKKATIVELHKAADAIHAKQDEIDAEYAKLQDRL